MVAVLTHTFNISEYLLNLYNSLCEQTNKSFKWYIIDDGSTDNTKDTVDDFISKSDFPIEYLYKENGGKHTALNVGISQIKEDLTFIVDSDDTVTPDAIETIIEYYEKYNSNNKICGFSFLRQFPDGKINGKLFEENDLVGSYIDVRINRDDTNADKAEVYFTKCLKEFPFPEYSREKFLGEDIVWIRMARKYKMVHINKAIYIGNYLNNGLTNNRRKHNIASPVGCMHRAKEFMGNGLKLKYRIKGALQYIIYGKFAGMHLSQLLKCDNNKLLVFSACPFGLLLYHKWKNAK